VENYHIVGTENSKTKIFSEIVFFSVKFDGNWNIMPIKQTKLIDIQIII